MFGSSDYYDSLFVGQIDRKNIYKLQHPHARRPAGTVFYVIHNGRGEIMHVYFKDWSKALKEEYKRRIASRYVSNDGTVSHRYDDVNLIGGFLGMPWFKKSRSKKSQSSSRRR
jgi:hypothetical protein